MILAILWLPVAGLLSLASPTRARAQANPDVKDASPRVPPSLESPREAATRTTLSGRVSDSEGHPVDHADVRISLTRDMDPGWTQPEKVRDWRVETDSEGRFKLEGIWNRKHADDFWVRVDVVAYGFLDLDRRYPLSRLSPDAAKPARIAIELKRGVRSFGRIIGADSKPVVGAEVRCAAKNWRGIPRYTDEQGRFSLTVPKDRASELLVYASNWAPRRVAVPVGRSDLGDIRLDAGTRMSVRIVSEDELRLSGQLVVVESTNDFSSFYLPMRLFKKTDEHGTAQFPALKGEFRVLSPQWSGGEPIVVGAPPFVAVPPRIVSLDGLRKHKELTLHAGPPLRLSGKVSAPDGEPAQGVRIYLSAAIGELRRGMTSTPLQWTKTDRNGSYVLEGIPGGLQQVSLHLLLGKWNGKAVVAGGTNPATGRKRYNNQISFRPLTKSYDRLDFDLKLREPSTTRTGPAWAEYLLLQEQLAQGSRTKEKAAHRFIRFAEQHSDQEVSVHALGAVCRIFGSMAPGVQQIDRARDQLIEMVTGDFLDHPDLSFVLAQSALRYCDNSVYPQVEQMLRTVIEKSPHVAVRGHACLHLADFLEVRTILKRVDDDTRHAMLAEAESLKDRVVAEFGAIPHITSMQPLAELAKGWSAYSAIGKTAPEIIGHDVDGNEFKLSEYRGKVVMLSFSGNWCAPCRKLYPEARMLVEKYKDQPFALLSVNSDSNVDSLKTSIAKGDITWRTWWDGSTDGPISTAYGVRSWPTIYVLDKQGRVRHVGMGPANTRLLEQLLQQSSD